MDPYNRIARYYDLEHAAFREDVQFYREYVQDDPVLEVGVGTGRIMHSLIEGGREVWGLDPSAAMLARAEHRIKEHERGHLIHASVADLKLDVRFRTVLLPLNVLWHLTSQAAQIQALRVLGQHMDRGAYLIIDLSNPLTMADRGSNGEVRQRFHYVDGSQDVRGLSACWDDEGEQRLSLSLIYDETMPDAVVHRTSTVLELRYLYRGELALLLQLTGFQLLHEYGSYDLEPYESNSSNLLVAASKRDH